MKNSYDQRYIARDHVKSSGPHAPNGCDRKERTRRGDGILHHNVKAVDSRHEKVFHEKPRPWRYPATPRNTLPVSLPSSSSRTPPPGSSHNIPLVGPPLIHRITSSSPRPALSYERIGDPSLGIFKLRLPEFMIGTLDDVVALAENHVATTRQGSWKTELYSLTRQDMAMRQIPGMKALIDPVLDYLTKTMEAMYGCRQVLMDQNQPHILKYSIDSRHTGVQLHHDLCDITTNLVLSKSDNYKGGGTFFPEANGGRIIRLKQGEFLLHPGSLLHGGVDIEKGTRFLMILFAHLSYD